MQCVERPELAFLVVGPHEFFADYEVYLGDDTAKEMALQKPEEAAVLALVSIQEGKAVTANLVGPVVVNTRTRRGKQIVLDNDQYTTRHTLCTLAPAPRPRRPRKRQGSDAYPYPAGRSKHQDRRRRRIDRDPDQRRSGPPRDRRAPHACACIAPNCWNRSSPRTCARPPPRPSSARSEPDLPDPQETEKKS